MLASAFPDIRPLLRAAGRGLLTAILPPRCLKCGAIVGSAGALCSGCWGKLNFIEPPYCACCGFPFEFHQGDDALCGVCMRIPPDFTRARSVLRYDDASRELVLRFKHADRTESAPPFAAWLKRAGGELVIEADLLVPVPLHWTRLLARRYNQAALLTSALARLTNRPALQDLLVRRRRTPSQGGLGRAGRESNVAGAFRVHPRHIRRLKDKRVLLVDDVMTTGATAGACSRALRRAGAASVDVLTLARVVRPAA
ncbi:MAG TPA: ComF family protein [Dongiaceae bacterium]|jgi:ComF family protein